MAKEMKSKRTSNDQMSDVHNPYTTDYILDHKNTIRQLQRIEGRTLEQEERLREVQRELSYAFTLQSESKE